ncbi:MAG: ribonucleoside-diphosphate reductase, adenosylcobalamin-dependent [Euryarchaeota archaeon]|nr:ribonucleoside-diphosphate reductase, adenosylcobalamin-dependent [Euryarchaeota archaeon]|tara:strand:+ start:14438 stop:16948 length:2511 start_codon:yes stop_codon:yes gene_type:complete
MQKSETLNGYANMFDFDSNLAKKVGEEPVQTYKKLLSYVKEKQADGTLPLHSTDYLCGNELAKNIFEKKYYLKDLDINLVDKRPEDVYARLSAFIASLEDSDEGREKWASEFYNDLYNGYYVPGGRVLAGAGDLYRLKTLANCFVALIKKDSIESIYDAAYQCARTESYGGGIGIDVSTLRPKGAVVHNAADTSTGAVSFMDIYSLTTGLIGQSGRRGALMLTLDVKHPDIMDFLKVKKVSNWVTKQIVEQCSWSGKFTDAQLEIIEKQVRDNTQIRFANISIKVSDEFMQAVDEQTSHDSDKLLLYKKPKGTVMKAPQTLALNYSHGVPSKDVSEYELLGDFDSIDSLNEKLHSDYDLKVNVSDLEDIKKRDIYGDYSLETNKDYDLAVKYSGDFLLYFASDDTGEVRNLVKAREVWDLFIEGNYQTAEPGLIFWSSMTKYSPSNYVERPISSTNPCGEVPLEDGGACNLGSINLSRMVDKGYTDNASINFERLDHSAKNLTRFLDNVVTWNESLNALESQRIAAGETRRLGIGVMGIADLLNQLGLGYDSDEALEIIEKVMCRIANTIYRTSAHLAEEKGSSAIYDYEKYSKNPFFQESLDEETKQIIKEKGLRNIALLSIAPTGSISNIVLGFKDGDKNYMGVSGGVEPIFALYYTRRSESFGNKIFKVFHGTVQAYLDIKGLSDKVENLESDDSLKGLLPEHFFRTAHNIVPQKRIEVQSICQKYIDHSISSTCNLPEDIEPEVISNMYLEAWRKGLKGITIYREGSRYPILSIGSKSSEFQDFKNKIFKIASEDGKKQTLKGDSIISLADGRLTTVYHAVKSGKIDLGGVK